MKEPGFISTVEARLLELLLVVILTLFVYHHYLKKKPTPPAPQTQAAPKPSQEGKALATSSAQTQTVVLEKPKDRFVCSDPSDQLVLESKKELKFYFSNSASHPVILKPKHFSCPVVTGKKYKIVDQASREIYGEATVESMTLFPNIDQIPQPIFTNVQMSPQEAEQFLYWNFGLNGAKDEIEAITLGPIRWTSPRKRPHLSLKEIRNHPIIKTLNYNQFKEVNLTASRMTLVDVRSEGEYNNRHLSQAINLPYTSLAPVDFGYFYKNMVEVANLKVNFDIDRLKPFKNNPILIYGSNTNDFRAQRVLGLLLRAGFDQLYYLEGGLTSSGTIPDEVPKSVSWVKILTTQEFLAARDHGAAVFDIRDPWIDTAPVPGASLLEYFEKYYLYNSLLRLKPAEILFELVDSGEKMDTSIFPKDKNQPLVFYCYDQYCWTALKAAAWAIARGRPAVSVYREGLTGWLEWQWLHKSPKEPLAKLPY